jgi:pimeloyl-ACP methyl ester carboxylesterase
MKIKQYHLNVVEYPKNAPKIVFLHGLGGTHRYWSSGLEQLTKDYHVILVDLLGFGDSEKPWINYTKERHVKALHHTLKNYDQFVLVGHSLGAALAIAYKAQYPEQVLAQILLSLPLFQSEDAAYRWMRRAPSGWLLTNTLTAAITCMVTRHIMGIFLPKILKEFPLEIVEDLLKHNIFSSITSLWQVIYHATIAKDFVSQQNNGKTIFIHALNDDTAPYEAIEQLIKDNPNHELISLKHSSHHPWLWDNEICVNTIEQLMDNISANSKF